tara:strand:+ start:590 stop:1567 length:978 start_codon:yes stop_codon:yes gene_type:complete
MVNHDSRILITGGDGFIGSHLALYLQGLGYENIFPCPKTAEANLNVSAAVGYAFEWANPDCVIHLASKNSGLHNNIKYPAGIMHENLDMGLKVFEEARLYNVKKFIMAGDMSCYSPQSPVPFKEEDMWMGEAHISKRFYSHAKRILMEYNGAMSSQFDWCGINLIFSDVYGVGNKWNPLAGNIIPVAISQVALAQDEDRPLELSGDKNLTRDFIHVNDVCRAIELCVSKQDQPIGFNVGSGVGTTLEQLHEKIAHLMGYTGITWSEGESYLPKKAVLSNKLINKTLGWKPIMDIDSGLKELVLHQRTQMGVGRFTRDSLGMNHLI